MPVPVVDKEGVEDIAVEVLCSNEREDPVDLEDLVDLEGRGLADEAEGLKGREDQGGQRTQGRGMKNYITSVDRMVECCTGVVDLKDQADQVLRVLYRGHMVLVEQSARKHQHPDKVGIPGVVDHVGMRVRYPSGLDSV